MQEGAGDEGFMDCFRRGWFGGGGAAVRIRQLRLREEPDGATE
jgi:hypothetical protein